MIGWVIAALWIVAVVMVVRSIQLEDRWPIEPAIRSWRWTYALILIAVVSSIVVIVLAFR